MMPFMNLRNPHEFDPQDYDYQNAGGLPGMLREAMQRQGLQQENQAGATANSAPSPHTDGYGNPQGLFGRLLALQANKVSPTGMSQGGAPSGAAAMATPVQFSIPIRPGPFPSGPFPNPPTDPQKLPQIPMPHLQFPEPWPTIGKIMQVLPGLAGGLMRGLIEKDDEPCPNCQHEENASTEGTKKAPGGPGAPKTPLPISPFSPKSNKSPGSSGGYGGGGGRRNRRDDDDSQCYERENQELENCNKRLEEYPHWDFFDACKKRASIRRDLCVRNKGNLNHDGPKEWGPDSEGDDEEIWYNGPLWK